MAKNKEDYKEDYREEKNIPRGDAPPTPNIPTTNEDERSQLNRLKEELEGKKRDLQVQQQKLDEEKAQFDKKKSELQSVVGSGSGGSRKMYRVALEHSPDRLIEVEVPPGTNGMGERALAVSEYNKRMGIISTTHVHSVVEISDPKELEAAKLRTRPADVFGADSFPKGSPGTNRDQLPPHPFQVAPNKAPDDLNRDAGLDVGKNVIQGERSQDTSEKK